MIEPAKPRWPTGSRMFVFRTLTAPAILLLFVLIQTMQGQALDSELAKNIERGWSVTSLLGKPVVTLTETELGRLKNILVGRGGYIDALVVAGQGSTVSREFQFRVPWSRVDVTLMPEKIVVEAEASEHLGSVYSSPPAAARDEGELVATELLGGSAGLSSGELYGYITNVVFSREGQAVALFVKRDGQTYAFPFRIWVIGWEPESGSYRLPYANVAEADQAAVRVIP